MNITVVVMKVSNRQNASTSHHINFHITEKDNSENGFGLFLIKFWAIYISFAKLMAWTWFSLYCAGMICDVITEDVYKTGSVYNHDYCA